MTVYIEDIADKMEEVDEEWQAFLNLNTGEIVDVGRRYHGIAEELEEDEEIPANLPKWEKELVQTALEDSHISRVLNNTPSVLGPQ